YGTMIAAAEESLNKKDYYSALDWYEKAYDERKSDDLVGVIADMHYELRDYKKAENYYKRLLRPRRGKEPEIDPAIRFKYGRVLKMNSSYDEAIEQFQKVAAGTQDEKLKELAEYEITGAEMTKVADR